MTARLHLPQVTLCAVDTRAPGLATQSLQWSMRGIDFARVLLFTREWHPPQRPEGIEVVEIDPITSGEDYSRFVMHRLADHVDTPHVLVTQWDGFVADPAAWTDEFLEWDYIGPVWPEQPPERSVGNGGFSLRSRRFLEASRDPRIVGVHPEDEVLCRTHRPLLESEHGIRFAPPALARRFAFENEAPRVPTFGFHGPYNLPRLLDEATIVDWMGQLPDGFFRTRDARRLARALVLRRMPQAAREVVRRRAAVGRNELATRVIGAAAWLLGG